MNINPSDIRWKTRHCKLVCIIVLINESISFNPRQLLQGFNVMGIWPPYSDGSEVNALDVSLEKGVVVTGNNEGGLLRLFNFPCVVKSGQHHR